MSENIRVTVFWTVSLNIPVFTIFHNGGEPEIYSGSADYMPAIFFKAS